MEIYMVKILDLNTNEINNLMEFINEERKKKIDRLKYTKNKTSSIISDILIRSIISDKLNVKNNKIQFKRTNYGKPYLDNTLNFHFNISHSGDYVVCAIDKNIIGIDIEEKKDIDYESIAKNFFCNDEIEFILEGNYDERLTKFYRMWTLKESYVKANGKGLSIPLNSFSIKIDEGKEIKLIATKDKEKYGFKTLSKELGYEISVCSLGEEITNEVICIEQEELIERFNNINLK
ncbi:4'-phosphopantetheinyl transferase family protein (plasmid) [Clostridium butyricum]|uniref:4'-phosphopantetheinyl transferase family protein n=1 Tax=Clostridium butyricum TaxID=1492 RepID=UPI003D0AF259